MAIVAWDATFQASPLGSASPAEGDDRIRELKENLQNRLTKEMKWALSPGSATTQGWMRQGSAVAYYAATAPTLRPDGATALSSDDAGRLWLDSDDGTVDYWNGTAMADLKVPAIDVVTSSAAKSADYTVLDDDSDLFLVTTADTDRTITLPTASANTGRVVVVKKVDDGTGTVTVDGEGAETIDGAATIVINAQYGSATLYCNGTSWNLLAFNTGGTALYAMDQDVQTTDDVEFGSVDCAVLSVDAFDPESFALHGTYTYAQIFAALSPYIPEVGDRILVYGGCSFSSKGIILSEVLQGGTSVQLRGINSDTGAATSVNATESGATSINVSIRWIQKSVVE
jgi:hypothetical protein